MNHNKQRALFLFLFVALILALLLIPFFRLQIKEGEHWTKIANRQHFTLVKEPYERGVFLSNYTLRPHHSCPPTSFVVDVQKYHLYIDPEAFNEEQKKELIQVLSSFSSPTHLSEIVHKKSRSRKLLSWLSKETKNNLQTWWSVFAKSQKLPKNALYFVKDYQRSYPLGKLAGQILHTIQEQKEEKTKHALPTGGLELSLNALLEGKEGKKVLMRSPRNAFETAKLLQPAQMGAHIELTLDPYIQAVAEEELQIGVEKAQAKAGIALAMDPSSGEILAFAHFPFFYPDHYPDYFNDKDKVEWTKARGIIDAFEPGSTFKIFILALALKANELSGGAIFSPEEKIKTKTAFFPGRRKPVKDVREHKYLNMYMALQKSSNVYFAVLMQRMIEVFGEEWVLFELRETFGFGEKTGIELFGESSGFLPDPKKTYPNGAKQLSKGTPYCLCMGHSMQTTCVQLIRALSVIANGGTLVTPHLVKRIYKGEPIKEYKTKQTLDPSIAKTVTFAMKFVTKEGGTAKRADVQGFTEAGKSGTSAKVDKGCYSEEKYLTSFIGFAPAKNPSLAIAIILDEPKKMWIPGVGKNHHGGVSAAPIFERIASKSLAYLGVPYDDPHGFPYGDKRRDHQKADYLKEVKELKELYEAFQSEVP